MMSVQKDDGGWWRDKDLSTEDEPSWMRKEQRD